MPPLLRAEDDDRFRATPTDLVITDLVRPKKEGLATGPELRGEHPMLGIIAMSGRLAHHPALDLTRAGTFGANRTLRKPFGLATLLKAIHDVPAESGQAHPA